MAKKKIQIKNSFNVNIQGNVIDIAPVINLGSSKVKIKLTPKIKSK